jgi:type I restriction enzyme S subunit
VVRRFTSGTTPPTEEASYYSDGSVPWYSPGTFTDLDPVLREPAKYLNISAVRDGVARIFPTQTTMVVTIGATLGRVAELEGPASANQQITALVANEEVEPRFLTWQLKSLRTVIRALAPTTTMPIVNQDRLGQVTIAVPPRDEQARVARRLDEQAEIVRELDNTLSSQIALLADKRRALIVGAVTGCQEPPVELAA